MASRYNEEDYELVRIDGVRALYPSKSGNALLCSHESWDNPVWIVQSLIGDDSEVYRKGDEGILVIPRWLAIKENMM